MRLWSEQQLHVRCLGWRLAARDSWPFDEAAAVMPPFCFLLGVLVKSLLSRC